MLGNANNTYITKLQYKKKVQQNGYIQITEYNNYAEKELYKGYSCLTNRLHQL